jgi:hypothetical protein
MDPTNAVDYTGYVVFSGTAPPAGDVQALVQELLLNTAAVQAALDGNPAIGQDAVVEEVTVGARVALSNVMVIITTDDTDTVDESQFTKTLEDYLVAGIMQEHPTAVDVMLNGVETQIDGFIVLDYTGYAVFFDTRPPPAEDVESLGRDLMLDLTDVQAAVDTDLGIGQNVRVEQVVVGDDSVVALSDFIIVFSSDDINAVNQAELARSLEGYLMAGLMQAFPDVDAVVLQPEASQQSDAILFSGFAVFAGSVPDFRDVQSSARGLLEDIPSVQTAVDINPIIGGDILVSAVVFDDAEDNDDNDDIVPIVDPVERSSDDNDDSKTAKIVGGVVGGGAVCLALVFIFMGRRSRIRPEHDNGNAESSSSLASKPAPLPSGAASHSKDPNGTSGALAVPAIEEGVEESKVETSYYSASLLDEESLASKPAPLPSGVASHSEDPNGTSGALALPAIEEGVEESKVETSYYSASLF